MPTLKSYAKSLKRNTSPIECPHCRDPVAAELFERHCLAKHGLDPETNCAWCFGHALLNDGCRADHLSRCYSSFLSSSSSSSPSSGPSWDASLPCEDKTFFDEPTPDLFETPVWELQPTPQGLKFQCPRVDLAVGCLQLYLNTDKSSTVWMHVMVKAGPGYLDFLKAVDADEGETRTLPFSCLCKGGGVRHRHFVVLSTLRNRFTNTASVKREPIRSPMHLVRLLTSFGRRRSECRFNFRNHPGDSSDHHYYVSVSLPPATEIVLAMQWDGGLTELVYERYASTDPGLFLAVSENGLPGVRFRDLPGIFLDLPLPVSKNFKLSSSAVTEYYLHLFRGWKLYFEPLEAKEESGGDAADREFRELVGNAVYYPTPQQQKFMLGVAPFLRETEALRSAAGEARSESDRLRASNAGLKRTCKTLKRKFGTSEERLKSLQRKHIEYLERENDKLRADSLKRMRATLDG